MLHSCGSALGTEVHQGPASSHCGAIPGCTPLALCSCCCAAALMCRADRPSDWGRLSPVECQLDAYAAHCQIWAMTAAHAVQGSEFYSRQSCSSAAQHPQVPTLRAPLPAAAAGPVAAVKVWIAPSDEARAVGLPAV